MLSRVEDLERSAQWTSLANDINELERLCLDTRPVIRRDKRGIEKYTYQRGSIPEVQRACTVHFDDDRDTPSRDPGSENSRWSWKPRTDFEREYFYKDYRDYCGGDSAKYFEPTYHEVAPRERSCAQRSNESPARSSVRYPGGLEKEHLSDSRDRLHEIFEHNRYLRRQFFAANVPGNGRQNCGGGYAGNSGRSNQESSCGRCAIGFGSTETLTSQSNQSSVSSINERKCRAQTTRSPEEDSLSELAGRNNVDPSAIDRGDQRTDGSSRVLVNILPGSEVRRVDVRNVAASVRLDEASNERSEDSSAAIIEEARFRNATRQPEMLDKSSQCDITENDRPGSAREKNLPEYIFGATRSELDTRRPRNSFGKSERRNDRLGEFERNRFSDTRSERISENGRLNSVETESTSRGDDNRIREVTAPNLTIVKQSTPLYIARAVRVSEETESSDDKPRVVMSSRESGQREKERRSERREEIEGRTRSIGHEQSAVSADEKSVSSNCLTARSRVKLARIPPPLDLSTVNEQCEYMESDERRCLNDYSVDVAILRKQEDLLEDLLTAAVRNKRTGNVRNTGRNDVSSWFDDGIIEDSQRCGRNDRRRPPLHKSCGDLSLSDELQSPQLVNNYKSSSDLRAIDDASFRTLRGSIDPDDRRHNRAASPLFDQTNPIGGLHAAGSTLPSTVYGPIPYSQ